MAEENGLKALVTDDPLTGLPKGTGLQVRPINYSISDADKKSQSVKNWDFFHGAILGLSLNSELTKDLIGTAVMIAPGLAVTATHNLTHVLSDLKTGAVVPYLFGIRPDSVDIWRATSISFNEKDDISYLSLVACSALPQDNTYYVLLITTGEPKIGEHIEIVGFRNEAVEGASSSTIEMNLYIAKGSVNAVYPTGRGSIMPYAAIEVECGSLGGMSGGAAIDSRGHVLGVIARGWSIEDGLGPTYLSWMVTTLHRPLDIVWPPGLHQPRCTPLSMSGKTLFMDRPEALKILPGDILMVERWS